MNIKNSLLLLSSFMMMFFIGCEDSDGDDTNVVTTIETPTEYSFSSRFDDGQSSVYYNGQVVRNLLINDVKTQLGTDAGSGDASTILSMMANDNADATILSSTTPSASQLTYQSISGSNLNDRLTAVADYTLPGYNTDAGSAISGWVSDLVNNGKTSSDGVRLDQMIQKTLWGAVSYWQGTSKYMSKIPTDDNTMKDGEDSWSVMEHHWDESFGYFGAARDYHTSSSYADDSARKSDYYYDSNGDGSIDYTSEYNVGWAITAAKRDLCDDCDVNYDFTKTIFEAYLEGRTLIANQADLTDILVQRDIILNTWEKVVAAVTVHYINDVAADMAALYQVDSTAGPSSEASADLNNHWGEMRGYANGLLYNDFRLISDDQLTTVLTIMGTAPVYPEAGSQAFYTYHGMLLTAVKDAIQEAYGFSDANMAGW